MKTKILAFLGMVVAVIGVSLFAVTTPLHAKGEKYEWINPTTIRASGGLYNQVTAAKNGVIDFPQQADGTFQITSKGDCTITMTITVTSADNTKAKLVTKGCDTAAKDFDRDLTIAHPEKGPVGYETANCNDPNQNHGDSTKCAAVQACTKAGSIADDCSTAYDTCFTNHTVDGKISDTDKNNCINFVTTNDLSSANAQPVGDAKTTCSIQGIGWIVCPVVNFLAKVVDGAYAFVASLLKVQPLYVNGATGTDSAAKSVYTAWSIMRNFANIVFVVMFLFIIFSQVTSIGITNYGIKRMLPRLIIAAVLVNLSYWVCAIAIDVSNILGISMSGLFDSLKASLSLPSSTAYGGNGDGWQGIVGPILAGTIGTVTIVYIGLSALLPMLIAALVAVLTVFLVLTLRQALIVLLVIISPLAFVAYLLPNTESWFKKWRELFQTLLLMYPIVGVIFGASALASQIVMSTAPNSDYKIAIQLMGAGIAVIPLAITPIIMRTAGGVLNRFGAFVNNPNKGPFDRMRKAAEGYRSNRQDYRRLKGLTGYRTLPFKGTAARMGVSRQAVLDNRKRELQRATDFERANKITGKNNFASKLAQGGTNGAEQRAIAQALSTKMQLQLEEVKAERVSIEGETDEGRLMTTIKNEDKSNSEAKIAAAVERLVKIGKMENIETVVDTYGHAGDSIITRSLGEALSKDGPQYLKGSDIDIISHGKMAEGSTLATVTRDNIEAGALSQEKMVGSTTDQLGYISRNSSAEGKAVLKQTALDLKEKTNPLNGRIKQNRDAIDSLAAYNAPPASPPTPPPATP